MLQHIGIDVTSEFKHQFESWRQKRPEWKRFIDALKQETTPRAALYLAAAAAGASTNEVGEISHLLSRVRSDGSEADKLEAAEAAIALAERNLAKARGKLDEKGMSANETEAAWRAVSDCERLLQIVQSNAVGPRLAAQTRAAASEMGLV